MSEFIQVEGHSSLKRDSYSTAVVNTNQREYEQYMSHRERKLRELEEMECLKNEVSEIKSMMKLILDKL